MKITPVITRLRHRARIERLLGQNPIVAILGARQVGKTTLARQIAAGRDESHWFDLEDPEDLRRLEDAKLALADLRGLIVVDEVQRRPELFPLLRVLADRSDAPRQFLLLGSASPELLRQSSESLAGRIAYHELSGFALDEVGAESADRLWLRGGFARSFLAPDDLASADWRRSFVRTFLERDLPQLGVQISGTTLHRFWQMIAHYHAQLWNGAELARAFGVSATTVRRYLDVLTDTLVLRQIPPWHENLSKRQIRSPKVYVADSGLLHALLGIEDMDDLVGHPKVGASWEGFALFETVIALGARTEECYFWGTHGGAEIDLMLVRGQRRVGVEFKRTTTPSMTRSMRIAAEDLKLDEVFVVHAGEHTFPLADGASAVAFRRLRSDMKPLG
jgi:uncharacterized protein